MKVNCALCMITVLIAASLLGCFFPGGGWLGEAWWEHAGADKRIIFLKPVGPEDSFRGLQSGDSVAVSLSGFVSASRLNDSSLSVQLAAEVWLRNYKAAKAVARLDGQKLRILVDDTPLKPTHLKDLKVRNEERPSHAVLEWLGETRLYQPSGTRHSPNIRIIFGDAVTLDGRPVTMDSIVATIAEPILF